MAGAVGSKLGSAGGAVAGVLGGGGSGTASLDPMKSGVLNVGGKSSVIHATTVDPRLLQILQSHQ